MRQAVCPHTRTQSVCLSVSVGRASSGTGLAAHVSLKIFIVRLPWIFIGLCRLFLSRLNHRQRPVRTVL